MGRKVKISTFTVINNHFDNIVNSMKYYQLPRYAMMCQYEGSVVINGFQEFRNLFI